MASRLEVLNLREKDAMTCTCGANYKLHPVDCPVHGTRNAAADIVTRLVPDGHLADGVGLDDLIGEIAAAIEREKQARKAQITAVLHTIGGTVEGYPTQSINYLQRLRHLVEIEKAARGVVWFDWSSNDHDAAATIDELRRAMTPP